MLFSFEFITFVRPIDFGPDGQSEAPELKHFLFSSKAGSNDATIFNYFHPARYCMAVPKCRRSTACRENALAAPKRRRTTAGDIVEFEMGMALP
jgi:hypothetical protein